MKWRCEAEENEEPEEGEAAAFACSLHLLLKIQRGPGQVAQLARA